MTLIGLSGLTILHKMGNVDICRESPINEKAIAEQTQITENVNERLKDLQLAMDSATMLGDELLIKQTMQSKSIKRKNAQLDMENEQLSRAVNDLYSDTIVVRDTTYITHKK
jgi:hypothetical protein